MQGSVHRWAEEFLVCLSASFGMGTGWAEPSPGSVGGLKELGCTGGSWRWWGAIPPGWWVPLCEKHRNRLGCRNGGKKVISAWQRCSWLPCSAQFVAW